MRNLMGNQCIQTAILHVCSDKSIGWLFTRARNRATTWAAHVFLFEYVGIFFTCVYLVLVARLLTDYLFELKMRECNYWIASHLEIIHRHLFPDPFLQSNEKHNHLCMEYQHISTVAKTE